MIHHTAFLLAVTLTLIFSPQKIYAQFENPAQTAVAKIVNEAPEREVDANLIGLFWKANLKDSKITVPLRNVEFYGVQDYIVDGATKVRELTISTDARSLIRIYNIQPLEVVNRVTNRLDNLRDIAGGKTGSDENRPVKVFPTTTHTHMVEYRVEDRGAIDRLHDHLESVMIQYHARFLAKDDQIQIVKGIEVE